MEDKIKRLEEENARLREALDRIREHLQACLRLIKRIWIRSLPTTT